jgi:peptidoglycan-associated lipoprotein
MSDTSKSIAAMFIVAACALAGCSRKTAPVTVPPPPATVPVAPVANPPAPPAEGRLEATPIAEAPLVEERLSDRTLEDLNRDSPLGPVFFALDSSDLDEAGRAVATANAGILKRFSTWAVTIEGHCDERGTSEYNLALGERRAMAVNACLASFGVSPDRVRTVSYGEEYPFDRGHTDAAMS